MPRRPHAKLRLHPIIQPPYRDARDTSVIALQSLTAEPAQFRFHLSQREPRLMDSRLRNRPSSMSSASIASAAAITSFEFVERARVHRQLDHTLLLGFEIYAHGLFSFRRTLSAAGL